MFLLAMCIKIVSIDQPATATIGEEIDITLNIDMTPETDDTQHLIFGFLAPESWDVEGTASVSYTSSAGSGSMSLVDDAEIATNSPTGLNWVNEMQEVLGKEGIMEK